MRWPSGASFPVVEMQEKAYLMCLEQGQTRVPGPVPPPPQFLAQAGSSPLQAVAFHL